MLVFAYKHIGSGDKRPMNINVVTAILAMSAAHIGAFIDNCKPRKRTMKTRKQSWLLGLAMLVMSGTVSGTEYPVTVFDDPNSLVVLTSPNVAVITVHYGQAEDSCPNTAPGPHSTCTLIIRAYGDYYTDYRPDDPNNIRRDIFVSDKTSNSVTTYSLEYNTNYEGRIEFDINGLGGIRRFSQPLSYFRTHAKRPTDPEPPEPPEPPETPETPMCEWQEAAFIPVMTESRPEGRDSKLWFANRGDNPVRVRITGWDSDGREYSGFEREIPAKRPTKVLMREIEDAIGNGEGHWSLTIESTGTVHVVAFAISADGTAHDTLPVLPMHECTE